MKPIDVSVTDYHLMVAMFENESDRGAAVLAGSYVENQLGLYLKSKMKDVALADRLFASEGPLSSFSQRIDLCQAFGFLSKEQCTDLNLIKKIRNHFAHHPKDASFKSSPISDWIRNLTASNTKIISPIGTSTKIDDPRLLYLISTGMFVAFTGIINN